MLKTKINDEYQWVKESLKQTYKHFRGRFPKNTDTIQTGIKTKVNYEFGVPIEESFGQKVKTFKDLYNQTITHMKEKTPVLIALEEEIGYIYSLAGNN